MFYRFFSMALLVGLATEVDAQSVDVPSGLDVTLYDVILDEAPEVARFRFLVPAIGRDDAVSFSDVAIDFQFLCDALVIPGLAANGWETKEVVISMSAAEVPFGEVTEDVTQFFQPFSIAGDTCIWEDF